jgi:hypothetical protein
MKNISFWKKIKLFFFYRKTISNIDAQLEAQFNIRIDNAARMYTVLNIPKENFDEVYSIRKGDIDAIAQGFIKEYTNSLSEYLNSKGLGELYDFYDIKKVDRYSYLLVYGFSLLKTNKLYMSLYRIVFLFPPAFEYVNLYV